MWVHIRDHESVNAESAHAVYHETDQEGTEIWQFVIKATNGKVYYSGYMDKEIALRNLARFNQLVDAMEVDYGEEA